VNGRAWKWLVISTVAAAGCASATGWTPIPKSQDIAMGRAFAAEVNAQMPIEKDPRVNEGVVRIVRTLLEANGLMKEYEWELGVVRDDKTVNAFALPGGKMYVITGLIAAASDESEVAGVLAHEIAHVTERHGAERLTDMYGVQIAQQILLGNRGMIANAVGAMASKAGFLHFSRRQETEADEEGLKMLVKTDYDPHGMTRFFEKIAAMSGKTSAIEGFLSDHPDPAERVRETREMISKLPPAEQTGQTYRERWIAYRQYVVPGAAGGVPTPSGAPATAPR
jgi:beta-barrel assembly-enhancing protease